MRAVSTVAVVGLLGWQAGLVPGLADTDGEVVQHSQRIGSTFRIPVYFEQNVGQARADGRYIARATGHVAVLTDEGIVFASPPVSGRTAGVRFRWAGGRRVLGEADGPLPTRVSYFIGNNPAAWHRDVPTFAEVRYTAVYPGVDLVCHGRRGRLEYDLIVDSGAALNAVTLAVDGADSVEVEPDGALRIACGGTILRQRPPRAWQQTGTGHRDVGVTYALEGSAVHFKLGAHDASLPVTIGQDVESEPCESSGQAAVE